MSFTTNEMQLVTKFLWLKKDTPEDMLEQLHKAYGDAAPKMPTLNTWLKQIQHENVGQVVEEPVTVGKKPRKGSETAGRKGKKQQPEEKENAIQEQPDGIIADAKQASFPFSWS